MSSKLDKKDYANITQEDKDLIYSLNEVKKDLDKVYSNFEYATDDALIDSYIYEVKSLQLRYEYFLQKIKQRGIQATSFAFQNN